MSCPAETEPTKTLPLTSRVRERPVPWNRTETASATAEEQVNPAESVKIVVTSTTLDMMNSRENKDAKQAQGL
jgi:hypothetical protein